MKLTSVTLLFIEGKDLEKAFIYVFLIPTEKGFEMWFCFVLLGEKKRSCFFLFLAIMFMFKRLLHQLQTYCSKPNTTSSTKLIKPKLYDILELNDDWTTAEPDELDGSRKGWPSLYKRK